METSTLEFVIANLDAVKGRWPEVAEGSGIPLRTLEKVARRETKNPKNDTVEGLAKYFRANPPAIVKLLQQQDSAAA